MTVTLEAITCGHLTVPLSLLLEGRDGELRIPVGSYLITHPKGRVVFDTGLNAATKTNPADHIGDFLEAFHQVDIGQGEDLASRLESIQVDPTHITHVINSHLHFDHCGGNSQLPDSTFLVQREEWAAAHDLGIERGYVPADFDTGQQNLLLNGEHDVFGDGTVICFPTPGHTPGHQSARVRTDGGEYVLSGDACYLRESLEGLVLPGVIYDSERALDSMRLLRSMQSAGATVLYSHDPEFWRSLPKSPARIS